MHTSCYHCQSERVEYQFQVGTSSLYHCLDCDLVFLDTKEIPPSSPILPSTLTEQHLQKVIEYTQEQNDLRLLEIGCGNGSFLEMAQRQGFEVLGIESDESLALQAQKRLGEDKVFQGTWEQLKQIESIDVCVISKDFQHTPQLKELLETVHQKLSDQGTLLVVTPSSDSWSAQWFKNRWMEFKPNNLYYFNTQNLELFLIQAGFEGIQSSPSKRLFDFAYMNQQMKKFRVPLVSLLFQLLGWILPSFLQKISFKFAASEIQAICRKKPKSDALPKLSVVMPVFNEKATFVESLERVLNKELDGIEKEVILVESNSTDGTKEDVQKYENHPLVQVIYEDEPQGKGHATRAGIDRASGDFILVQDADLEYDINDYDQLLEPLVKYQKMFVLGSRHSGTWKMRSFEDRPLLSDFFNFGQILFTGLLNLFCQSKLKDPFTMYKVFRRECLEGITFEANRFDWDHEVVVKFLRKRYLPLEIPVNYTSRSYSEGKKVRIFRDPPLWVWAILKFRFSPLGRNSQSGESS